MFTWLKRHGVGRRSSAEALSRAIVPVLEQLEGRRMLTVSCGTLSSGSLTVSGDTNPDFVRVRTSGSNLLVDEDTNFDGSFETNRCTHAESNVTNLTINTSDDDDRIIIESSVATTVAITVNAGDGDDDIEGGNGADTLNGGNGIDRIWGHGGNDSMSGGADDDYLQGGGGSDVFAGGGGIDVARYDEKTSGQDVTVTIGSGTNNDGTSGEGDDVQGDIEDVWGGAGNDHITGDGDANLLDGGDGDDTLVGGAGADYLSGGNGADTADYSARANALIISLDNSPNDGESLEGDNVQTENVLGGSGADSITGDSADNTFFGNDGNDTIRGDFGEDSISGGTGSDTLYGDADNDTLHGGDSSQQNYAVIYGGDGNDHIYGYGVLYGEGGNDMFYLLNDGFTDTTDGGTGTDTVQGWDADDDQHWSNIETVNS